MPRKRRTRQHIIADLSANHFERWALLCGYSVERIEHDYGIDMLLFTYAPEGEIESGEIYIQLKASDNLPRLQDQQTIAFVVERSDLELWLQEPMPVILVVYDAQVDAAYWVYVQAYFERLLNFALHEMGRTVTIHIDTSHLVNAEALGRFAQFKQRVQNQTNEVTHDDS